MNYIEESAAKFAHGGDDCHLCSRPRNQESKYCVYSSEHAYLAAVERLKQQQQEQEHERPTWDETWLQFAEVMGKRSRCVRSRVGAIIVASDQTVISSGYNGPPRGFPGEGTCINWCSRARGDAPPDPNYDDDVAAHAEANAIARADYSRMQGSSLYISTSPCKGCAKLLANSGIVRVVFRHEEGREYRNWEATVNFLMQCGIDVVIIDAPAS